MAVELFTLPQAAAEQVTVQVTPVFEVLLTVAVNCALFPARTVAVVGATETLAAGTVIVAEFDLVVSVTEVAVTLTVRALAGGLAGAV